MVEELNSICRVCLSMEGKFFPIKAHGLNYLFEQLTGLQAKADDRLPPALCERCTNELRSYKQFQLTSKQSNNLLCDILKRFQYITKEFIASVKEETTNTEKQNAFKQEIFITSNKETLQPEVKVEVEHFSDDNCDNVYSETDCVGIVIENYTNTIDNNTAKPVKDKKTRRKKNLSKVTEVQTKRSLKRRKKVKRSKIKKSTKNDASASIKDEANALIKSYFRIKKLTNEEQVALYRKREETLHYKMAPFKCTKCYSGFISETMLNNHLVQHSDAKGLYECDICKTHFRTKCRIRIHLNYGPHHLRYECKQCNLVTAHRSTATQHADWHKGTTFECQHCNKVFNMKSSYKNHLRVKHASGFVCVLCGHNFFNEKGLSSHKARQHRLDGHLPVEGPKCIPCDIRFVSDDALNAHLNVSPKHVKNNKIWSSSYPTADPLGRNKLRLLRKQIRLTENKVGDAIICEQCGMELKNARAYHAHFRSKHPGHTRSLYPTLSRPLVCELCGRVFQADKTLQTEQLLLLKSKAQLSYHMSKHNGEKELKCTQCDEVFQTVAEFRSHKLKHVNSSCSVCGRKFTDPSNMRRHKKVVHTDARPYTCDLCGKTFKTTYLMKIHTDYVHDKKPWPKRKRQRQPTTAGESELDVEFEN